MKIRTIITVVLVLFFTISASAQEIYTLDQCKEFALKNNANLKMDKLSVEEASQTKKEALTHYFPKISADGFGYFIKEGLIGKDMENMLNQMGMVMPGIPEASDKKNGYVAGISVEQPIFVGGRIYYGNKLAKVGEEISRYQANESEKKLLVSIEQYYWSLVSLSEKRKTIEIMNDLASNLYKDVKAAVDAGVTNRSDLLQVQLQQNQIKNNRLELENGVKLLKMQLAQIMGISDPDFNISQEYTGELSDPQTLLVNHDEVLPNTNSHHLLNKSVEASQMQLKIEQGKYLPSVSLGASYYQYSDIFKNKNPSTMAFVSVSVPISDWWGGSHAIKRQKAQVQRAELEKTDSEQKLLLLMQSCWNKLDESYNKVLLAKQAIETAEENVRISTGSYKMGMSTLSDLINAQSLLQQSRDQHTEAYTGFLVARYIYLRETGR